MAQLTSPRSTLDAVVPAGPHAQRWRRLHDERRFRVGQLADLDHEPAHTPRHQSVQQALRIAAATALAQIDAALDRLAEGTYGRCIQCARPIPDERLDILPMTALCMPCHYNEQNCRIAAGL